MIAVALVLFATTNLPWQLDDYDQAKQAFTSFEMVECGHWFYQHTPNWWVATKPPLVGWVSALLYGILRSWEIAWRLPSFFAAIGLLFLVMRAASIYGPVATLIAACAFSFNLFSPRLASLVRTDMPLALVLFAIGWLIWKKIREQTEWTGRERLILFLLLSAGMLIKGPIVYALLLPGLIFFEWRPRRLGLASHAWSGWLPWLLSFLVFLIWVAGGILFVPEFTEHVVLREFAGRFSDQVHRAQPFYYYLPHLLHRFAPWSLLLIGLFIFGRTVTRFSPETFWLIAWSTGGLLVMSLVPSKRIDRIFPIVPPLCLLLGALVAHARSSERSGRILDRLCLIAVLLGVAGVSIYSAQKIVAARREHQDAFARFGRAALQQIATQHWRYGVVGGDDEGLLLYTRRIEFLEPGQAIADWNGGKIDALIVPDDELDGILPQLRGRAPKQYLASEQAGRYQRRYVLLAAAP